MIAEILAAAAGTVAFALMFGVPGSYYLYCGLIGGTGWTVYSLLCDACGSGGASLAAALAVVFLSRLAAVWKQCPVTVFLVSGIFPLVPGAGVYWTSYYIVTNQLGLAMETGYAAIKNAAAIVLGIVLIFELPQKFFERICFFKGKIHFK